ncbi:MAG: hypothetical protein JXB49_20870 [Bacteroidales bacterium]|nr:hypothetical protein [Bacteroidales bacterium]
MKIKFHIIFAFLLVSSLLYAQDDLDALLEEEMGEETEYTIATFLSTRVINCHSVEIMPKNGLDFRIAHRFGQFNTGFGEFFGLDESNSYLSIEYGVTKWMMAGVGRATYKKMFNGFVKPVILRQSSGKRTMPLSLVFYSSMAVNSTIYEEKVRNEDFISRMSYTDQLIIGRKCTPKLSLQLTPTFVHRNLVGTSDENNDLWAIGMGGRYKLLSRISVNFEYFKVYGNNATMGIKYYDPMSVGVDIQAGGHVFQLHLTNALPMTENAYIGETTGDFFNGDIRFGFNISQVFTLGR